MYKISKLQRCIIYAAQGRWICLPCRRKKESGLSVVSDPLWPHRLWPARLLRLWDFPGKSTGVGCHFLLQGIFPTRGSNPDLVHCRQMLYHLSYQGSPSKETWVQSLGQEDPLEQEIATRSSILAWEIPWTEDFWWATVRGIANSRTWLSGWHTHNKEDCQYFRTTIKGIQPIERWSLCCSPESYIIPYTSAMPQLNH